MNTQADILFDQSRFEQESKCKVKPFGAMLRGALGDHAWSKLESAIAARFATAVSDGKTAAYVQT